MMVRSRHVATCLVRIGFLVALRKPRNLSLAEKNLWKKCPSRIRVQNFLWPSTIWLFNIAMENPLKMEVYSWENHLFLWAMASMAMLVITRG